MRPDLRFVVEYNPLAVHPSFRGLPERRWGISNPEFRFTPLTGGRRHGPLLVEGGVEVKGLKYLDVEWPKEAAPKTLSVLVDNPGDSCSMEVTPVEETGRLLKDRAVSLPLPGPTFSWLVEGGYDMPSGMGHTNTNITPLTVDLAAMGSVTRLRLAFPMWDNRVRIKGLRFDNSRLNWPWEHRAELLIEDKSCDVGPMRFSFDPQSLLPDRLRRRPVRVINDCGTSVLLEIMPSGNDGNG